MEQERNEELEHHGTKGMKWGERRYQYKDGSLTPAGKKRYAKDVARLKAKNEKLDNKLRAKKAQEAALKRVAKLKAEAEAKKAALRGETDAAKNKAVETEAKKTKREEDIQKSLDKSDAAMAKRKLEIARSGDPKKIAANAHLFSDKEINDLKLRMDNEAAIQAKIPASKKSIVLKSLYKDIIVPTTNNVVQDYLKNVIKPKQQPQPKKK